MYKTLLLTEKIMLNYSGFYQGLSGYYMVFMNYIAALTLTRKTILFQFLSDCGVKGRPSKAKVLYENFSPSPTLSYTITKKPKNKICAKIIEGPKTPEGPQ